MVISMNEGIALLLRYGMQEALNYHFTAWMIGSSDHGIGGTYCRHLLPTPERDLAR